MPRRPRMVVVCTTGVRLSLRRGQANLVTPVLAVSEPRFDLIDLYSIEVEHYHNYYVGSAPGNSVLVHNGAGPSRRVHQRFEGVGFEFDG